MARLLKPNGDEMLRHLEEIRACSQEIQNIIVELALKKTTNQAVLSNALVRIHELDQRIISASEKAEAIRRANSERAKAAQEREARRRSESE